MTQQTYTLDDAQHATVLAALRFYQKGGQGCPFNRDDGIHEIATNGGAVAASLDADGIDVLCEHLNTSGKPQTQATPEQIKAVRERYASGSDDNIEVDDNAIVSVADEHVWVQAWLYLENE